MALGWLNIVRVAAYRLGVRFGLNSVRRLKASVPQGQFFLPTQAPNVVDAPAVLAWQTSALLFGRWPIPVTDTPPDWLSNPLNGKRITKPDRDWWQIPDFDSTVGDIKVVWELSRMDWVLAFAQRASQGDVASLKRLNEWLADWCIHNPPYKGPNWKCGQEASIRVLHLSMAALILGQVCSATPALRDLIHIHLERIAPTIQYAIAQDNNHGSSEAAALFMGGSWLVFLGVKDGERWADIGRRWLENRAARLIGPQGTFSQYSLNYHRMMLDTFCMVQVWTQQLGLLPFSRCLNERLLTATEWLRHMVNAFNGDGPNVGANDGARLLQLTNSHYRDYRPTVQLAMALFGGRRAYSQTGSWDHALQWLGVNLPQELASAPVSYVADDGGFAILRRGDVMTLLRYPRFRFRPSQADALHLDLWVKKDNILRDAGTYSYNTESQWFNYFGGTTSHNTFQFDGRDQMPRISRFLFDDWLETTHLQSLNQEGVATIFAAGYSDRLGASHYREVSMQDNSLKVVDEVQGFINRAVLRWRLITGDWCLQESPNGLLLSSNTLEHFSILVTSSVSIKRCEIVRGWESLHYMDKTPLQVLEVEIERAGSITTNVRWVA